MTPWLSNVREGPQDCKASIKSVASSNQENSKSKQNKEKDWNKMNDGNINYTYDHQQDMGTELSIRWYTF